MSEGEKRHAKQYLDDLYSSDPTLPRADAVILVALDCGCSDKEAAQCYDEWKKERRE